MMCNAGNRVVALVEGCGVMLCGDRATTPQLLVASALVTLLCVTLYHWNDPLQSGSHMIPSLGSLFTAVCVTLTIIAKAGPTKFINQSPPFRVLRALFDFYLKVATAVTLTGIVWRYTLTVCNIWINFLYAVLVRIQGNSGAFDCILDSINTVSFIYWFTAGVAGLYLFYTLEAVRFFTNFRLILLIVVWELEALVKRTLGCGRDDQDDTWFQMDGLAERRGMQGSAAQGRKKQTPKVSGGSCPFRRPQYDGLRLVYHGLQKHRKTMEGLQASFGTPPPRCSSHFSSQTFQHPHIN